MNRLAEETSPYLRQHMNNPVDWYPWGDEALARAHNEDRPILLSVGYSACHWCHVMERESFEDEETAKIMNALFVCVKVDREERPDLDELYMRSVQAFSRGSGGWPMTVFLRPDGRPFYAGTYFPPTPRQGMPSFQQVMHHVAALWSDKRDQVDALSGEVLEHLDSSGRLPGPSELGGSWLEELSKALAKNYDRVNGGFGGAPKFPPCGSLAALLAQAHIGHDKRALRMAVATLKGMARGGMYDLLAGGFARYSVDEAWRVPHFEKMLYDNGQLVPLYVDAWKLTGEEHFRWIAEQSCEWAIREMQLPHGAFAASQDADTEGEEGRYFVWTPLQVREAVGVIDGLRVSALLQVTPDGTFEHGSSVLRLEQTWGELDEADRELLLDSAIPALRAKRDERVAPDRDDKVIASWNGLMIEGLARAGAAFGRQDFVDAGISAMEVLVGPMSPEGRLHRTFKDDRLGARAFLDDHADMLSAQIALWEATFDARWIQEALSLSERIIALFWDAENGGFFYAGHDGEALVSRSKNPFGGATPSGNSVVAWCFARLAVLCGREDLGALSQSVLEQLQSIAARAPHALGVEALAASMRLGLGREVGVVGRSEELEAVLNTTYLPLTVKFAGDVDLGLFPWMKGRESAVGSAFVCEHGACLVPTRKPEKLRSQLVDRAAPRRGVRVRAPALPAAEEDWLNHAPISLEDLRGHVVVLDFWTYCCINCLHVLPVLKRIEEHYAGKPVVVIGVHAAKFDAEKERDNVAAAVERHGIRHPVVLDPTHELWHQYAVKSWPTLSIVDPTGRISWQQGGEADFQTLCDEIDLALDGELADPMWTVPPAQAAREGLDHPGKVQCFPGALGQARGDQARFAYISDTNNDRVLECAVSVEDGWPALLVRREFTGFTRPQGLDRDGNAIWVADTEAHAVAMIDLDSGAVGRVAGTGELGRVPFRPGRPLETPLRSPWDISAQEGMLFVAMAGTHQIWLFNPAEARLHPLVGSGAENHVDGKPEEAQLAQPSAIELVGRYLFWVDSETSSVRVYDLSQGHVGTIVGRGLFDFGDVDGEGDAVRMQHPLGLTAAGQHLYVADTFNGKIKRVGLPGGKTETLCAGLSEPGGLTVCGEHLLVADTNAGRIVSVHRETGELRACTLKT